MNNALHERIDKVTDRIHILSGWMATGTQYDSLWQHSTSRLRTLTRRLVVLTRGLAMLKAEASR